MCPNCGDGNVRTRFPEWGGEIDICDDCGYVLDAQDYQDVLDADDFERLMERRAYDAETGSTSW